MNSGKPSIRMTSVKLVRRILLPIAEGGLITLPEYGEMMANLEHLAKKGEFVPDVEPKLIDQKTVAEMLGISFPQFRALERENEFPFKRRKVGTKTVRYYNIDVLKYIQSLPTEEVGTGDNKSNQFLQVG